MAARIVTSNPTVAEVRRIGDIAEESGKGLADVAELMRLLAEQAEFDPSEEGDAAKAQSRFVILARVAEERVEQLGMMLSELLDIVSEEIVEDIVPVEA